MLTPYIPLEQISLPNLSMVQSGIPREEIFITTKVQAGAHTVEGCKRKVEKSLSDLGLGKS